MSRRYITTRAARLLFITRPHPYVFTLLFVIITQSLELIALEIGGQPFTMDLQAAAAGDAAGAIQFTPENMKLSTSLILLAISVLAVVVRYGYYSFSLHAVREEQASYYDMMDGFIVFFRAVVIALLTAILIYLGLLLLIVPGILVFYLYSQAPRLLLDHPEWSALRCMRESRNLMQGHLMEYFQLRLSLIGWNILCLFPVTSVFARPLSTFCETIYYLHLTGSLSPSTKTDPPTDQKPPWEY